MIGLEEPAEAVAGKIRLIDKTNASAINTWNLLLIVNRHSFSVTLLVSNKYDLTGTRYRKVSENVDLIA